MYWLTNKIAGVVLLLGLPKRAQETSESFFKGKCGMCHRTARNQQPWEKLDADLKTIITKGKDKMPEYETKWNKEQIGSLVAFIPKVAKKF